MKQRAGVIGWLVGPALAVAALDQWLKWLVVKNFALDESHSVIPQIMSLTYRQNPYTAFSLLRNIPPQALLLITLVLLALFMVLLWPHLQTRAGMLAGMLVLGGALGNAIDRAWRHYVVDYLDFHVWPVFNLADICVVVGVGLLVLTALRAERRQHAATGGSPHETCAP